jgi:hypothetical protein
MGIKVVLIEPYFAWTPILASHKYYTDLQMGWYNESSEDVKVAYGKEFLMDDHLRDPKTAPGLMKPSQVVRCLVHAIESNSPEYGFYILLVLECYS